MEDRVDPHGSGLRPRRVLRLRPRLRLVGKKLVPVFDVPRHERRRKLVERACLLFPTLALRKRWIRAKERLGPVKPLIEIGIERADITRAARSLREAGVHLEIGVDVPPFIRKLLRIQ